MQRLFMIEQSPQPFPPRTPERRTVIRVSDAVFADARRLRVTGICRRSAHTQIVHAPAQVEQQHVLVPRGIILDSGRTLAVTDLLTLTG
jgi:hypothetical protein